MPTPMRAVRVPDEIWRRVKRVAEREEATTSDVVRWALESFIEHRDRD